ncbi:hypothetical protein MMC10_010236 [Thelotrema lepadinum]|nr:hypothetical protein [Thelotrema lepadinum]
MANKAAKQLAARNTAVLKRVHLISAVVNTFFIVLRFLVFRSSCTRNTYLLYCLLAGPAIGIELWFESIARPTHDATGDLKRAGEDLEAKGLTEHLHDVLYWTWGVTTLAAIFGNRLWWLSIVIPLYSVYLAYTTFTGVRKGLAGFSGQDSEGSGTAISNRQKKIEKRGGQKVQHR